MQANLHPQYAIIVDAYSTGAQLAPKFLEQGVAVLHVQSSADVPDFFESSYRPADFRAAIVHTTISATLRQADTWLQGARPLCVMAGTETGVELADALAAAWGIPGNSAATSRARRDKYQMAQALRKAGLAAPECLRTADTAALLAWALQRQSWPVVVKPLDSAGNDHVYFCNDEAALRRAAAAILGKVNRMGANNDALLAQGFLRGRQFVVNSVSIGGRHYFCDIWEDRRKELPGASNVYDCEALLAADAADATVLTAYMAPVLDALGVREGPAHSEVMLTDDGPVLIETAARLQGSMLEPAIIDALGHSQITLAVERWCNPARFTARPGALYRLHKHVMCVAMISSQSGIVEGAPGLERIRALQSYSCDFHTPAPGEWISPTVDLFSIPGVIYLCHADAAMLQRDYGEIRAIELARQVFTVRHAEAA